MALYIVATPIGNLKDITIRALEVLKSVDYIVAEDTRVSSRLLARYEIKKPLYSFHEHSSEDALQKIITLLKEDKSFAYIVDAGTPGISDPGNYLVQKVSSEAPEVLIVPIPGPSALTTAISVAGFQMDKFVFMGFPPHKKGRQKYFQEVYDAPYSVVLYESPHRLIKTLKELSEVGLSMYECVLIKEISKVYERIVRMSIADMVQEFSKEKKQKGEFVLVINKKKNK
ncbi:MAG: 16S rRNA (cytidine(1402)-2'-O)-methyltransferase [Patescibacteria group bacterium]